MVQSFSCPELPDLLHFDLGAMADAEADSVEMHLAGCERCLALLDDLHPHDTLIDAMRSQETVTDLPKDDVRVHELIRTLKGLYPASAAAGATPPPQLTPPPDEYDFLTPPQQPGEMGRLGPYRILSVLGAGGMGVVFRAEDNQLHRLVALKALRPALAASPSARRRFLREAQAAAAVEHDHLVPIYQVGEDRGVPFLAMQLLQGESLESRLGRKGKLPLAEVVRIGREIAEGLSAAHGRGLIHRDIKPANIWLERKDQNGARKEDKRTEASNFSQSAFAFRVKILDFGLARPAADESGLTHPGVFVGTPLYGAPEQAGSDPVDHRCDLFSLGSVLYALCTGQPPFTGASNLAVLRRVCDDTPRPIREIQCCHARTLVQRHHDRHPLPRDPNAPADGLRPSQSHDRTDNRPGSQQKRQRGLDARPEPSPLPESIKRRPTDARTRPRQQPRQGHEDQKDEPGWLGKAHWRDSREEKTGVATTQAIWLLRLVLFRTDICFRFFCWRWAFKQGIPFGERFGLGRKRCEREYVLWQCDYPITRMHEHHI